MIAIGSVFEVFILELFGAILLFNGVFYKEKNTKKAFVPHREELPIDEELLAEMKRDMGDDFVPPRPKKKEEVKEEKTQEPKENQDDKPSEEKSPSPKNSNG